MQLLLLLLSYIPLLTQAVTVILSHAPNASPVAANQPTPTIIGLTCTNLRPGLCCQARQPQGNQGFRFASFRDLEALDIAAAWQPQGQPQGRTSGCSGTPVGTGTGPGLWQYPPGVAWGPVITGASYIRLPTSISDDRIGMPMREAQGILGFITGGTGWVSSFASLGVRQQAANAAAGLGSSLANLGLRKRSEWRRRGIVSKDKGVVIAQPPPGVQWPDRIMMGDGTNYTEESVGSPNYRNQDGAVLNLTGMGQ